MKRKIRQLFAPEQQKNKLRKTYIWTILSGLFYSGSTFLMFLITSNICDVYQAGIFTIAMTIGQQLVTIGYFNVRTYQASDVKEAHSFSEYLMFRMLTCCVMAAAGVAWILAGDFSFQKAAAVALMLLFKTAEAIADVAEGLYQQKDRYDVTGRCVFWETVGFLGTYILVLVTTKSLLAALAAMTVVYLMLLFVIDGNLVGKFAKIKLKLELPKQKQLFFTCLPLFINSFLVLYINSASKYAIDALSGEKLLTYFNIIFMPAFVINLLGSFLIKPLLTSMSLRYNNGEQHYFLNILKKQAIYIGGLTILCLGGAYVLGIPVLSFLYGLDLSGYRTELCILILGGAFSAIYLMLQYAIVIMRHQYASLAGCIITAIAAYVGIPVLVEAYSITGAAWGYFMLMVLMSLVYLIMTAYYLKKDWKSGEE